MNSSINQMKNIRKLLVYNVMATLVILFITIIFYNEEKLSPFITRGIIGLCIRLFLLALFMGNICSMYYVLVFYKKYNLKLDKSLLLLVPFAVYFVHFLYLMVKAVFFD